MDYISAEYTAAALVTSGYWVQWLVYYLHSQISSAQGHII